jgi:hypothetical protein
MVSGVDTGPSQRAALPPTTPTSRVCVPTARFHTWRPPAGTTPRLPPLIFTSQLASSEAVLRLIWQKKLKVPWSQTLTGRRLTKRVPPAKAVDCTATLS